MRDVPERHCKPSFSSDCLCPVGSLYLPGVAFFPLYFRGEHNEVLHTVVYEQVSYEDGNPVPEFPSSSSLPLFNFVTRKSKCRTQKLLAAALL